MLRVIIFTLLLLLFIQLLQHLECLVCNIDTNYFMRLCDSPTLLFYSTYYPRTRQIFFSLLHTILDTKKINNPRGGTENVYASYSTAVLTGLWTL